MTDPIADLRQRARALARQHPDYFAPGPLPWMERPEAERAEVRREDLELLGGWLSITAAELTEGPLRERMLRAIGVVSELTVTQLQLRADMRESRHEHSFSWTHFHRLVRGHNNCEGTNALLLLLLREMGLDVVTFETIELDTGRGDHVLVCLRTPQGKVFADAWSARPLMVLDTPVAGDFVDVPRVEEARALGLMEPDGIFEPECYRQGWEFSHRDDNVVGPSRDNTDDIIVGEQPLVGDVPEPVWRAYLAARIAHIFRCREEALEGYRRVVAEAPRSMSGRVAKFFVRRLEESPDHPRPAVLLS